MAIFLPSGAGGVDLPERFSANWNQQHQNCYARYYYPPASAEQLAGWIEDAFNAKTSRADLIQNDAAMMKYNSTCRNCGITH
jgi:hypothetical protein